MRTLRTTAAARGLPEQMSVQFFPCQVGQVGYAGDDAETPSTAATVLASHMDHGFLEMPPPPH